VRGGLSRQGMGRVRFVFDLLFDNGV